MSERLGELSTKLIVDGSDWKTGLASAGQDLVRFGETASRGDVSGMFNQVRGSFSAVSREFGLGNSAMAGWTSAAAGWGAALVGAASAVIGRVREASAEMKNLNSFALSVGVSTTDAQVLQRTFQTLGLDAEQSQQALNKVAQTLGEIRNDPRGAGGQVLRRLGLDPNQINSQGLRQNIEQIAGAIGRLDNVYDRNAAAQRIFGESYQRLIPLIRQGSTVMQDAAAATARTGFDESTVRTGAQAEAAWKRVGRTFDEIGAKLKSGFTSALSTVSLKIAETVEGVVNLGRRALEWLGLLDRRTPPRPPTPAALAPPRPESVGRTTEERLAALDARRPTILREGDIAFKLEDEREKLAERLFLERNLTSEAERLGLVRRGATRAEAEAVRDLVEQRRQAVSRGATGAELSRSDLLARDAAVSRRNQAVAISAEQTEQENRLRRVVDLEQVSAATAQARLDIERGVSVAVAERRRMASEEAAAIETGRRLRESLLTAEERFARVRRDVDQAEQRGLVTRAQGLAALGAEAQRIAQAVGAGPGSVSASLDGIAVGSAEAARAVAEFNARGRGEVDQLAQIVDAFRVAQQLDRERNRLLERVGEAVEQLEPIREAPANP